MGTLIVLSSPSGGGKNVIIRRLLEIFPESRRFSTTTTREPRLQEVVGKDYFFVTRGEFEQMIQENKLVEYNLYAGEYYGTEKEKLENMLKKYDYVFVAIDVNGKQALEKQGIPHQSIFLLPESLEVLRQRIQSRGGIGSEDLAQRLTVAKEELSKAKNYDLQVVNPQGNIESAVDKIVVFLQGEVDRKSKV